MAPEFKINSDSDTTLESHPVPEADFAFTQKYTYGGGLRIGYFLRPGILVYGRADALLSRFTSSFNAPGAPDENYRESRTLRGWDVGIGTEIAVQNGLSVRGEYVWSEFEGFNLDTHGNDPYTSLFKLGLAYHLGASGNAQDSPVDFSGAFFGVHGGIGDASSIELQGQVVNDSFYFGRGAHGAVLGGYAGYGVMLGNLYVAGEAEADWLDVEMSENVADGTQNGFRIDNTYGVSVLAGYRIANAALLYGRIGYANSRIAYLSNTPVGNESDRLDGFRLGAGLQIAVTDDVMLRWDYAHTRYEELDYTDPDGNANILKPQENLFRLGVGYQY